MRPKDYIEQKSCENCCFVFIKQEYEDPYEYFCTLKDRKPRPKCGSVLMGENFTWNRGKWGGCPELTTWEAWAKARVVMAWGGCPSYAPKPK